MYNNKCEVNEYQTTLWGISSAGRAPALHAGGQEFESPILHHKREYQSILSFILLLFKIIIKGHLVLEQGTLKTRNF